MHALNSLRPFVCMQSVPLYYEFADAFSWRCIYFLAVQYFLCNSRDQTLYMYSSTLTFAGPLMSWKHNRKMFDPYIGILTLLIWPYLRQIVSSEDWQKMLTSLCYREGRQMMVQAVMVCVKLKNLESVNRTGSTSPRKGRHLRQVWIDVLNGNHVIQMVRNLLWGFVHCEDRKKLFFS